MRITVRLLATYRRYLPEEHDANGGYAREIAPDTRVGDVVGDLPIPSGEVYTFFVNGRHADRDQILQAGDVLAVFPAVGGG